MFLLSLPREVCDLILDLSSPLLQWKFCTTSKVKLEIHLIFAVLHAHNSFMQALKQHIQKIVIIDDYRADVGGRHVGSTKIYGNFFFRTTLNRLRQWRSNQPIVFARSRPPTESVTSFSSVSQWRSRRSYGQGYAHNGMDFETRIVQDAWGRQLSPSWTRAVHNGDVLAVLAIIEYGIIHDFDVATLKLELPSTNSVHEAYNSGSAPLRLSVSIPEPSDAILLACKNGHEHLAILMLELEEQNTSQDIASKYLKFNQLSTTVLDAVSYASSHKFCEQLINQLVRRAVKAMATAEGEGEGVVRNTATVVVVAITASAISLVANQASCSPLVPISSSFGCHKTPAMEAQPLSEIQNLMPVHCART
jgi:hypothetical protein